MEYRIKDHPIGGEVETEARVAPCGDGDVEVILVVKDDEEDSDLPPLPLADDEGGTCWRGTTKQARDFARALYAAADEAEGEDE